MDNWNCCRICLSKNSLHEIFRENVNKNETSTSLLNATGLKIKPNDRLPHTICTPCISKIEDIKAFQKQCYANEKIFLERLNQKICTVSVNEVSVINNEFCFVNASTMLSEDMESERIGNNFSENANDDADNDTDDINDMEDNFDDISQTVIVSKNLRNKCDEDLTEFEGTVEELLKKGSDIKFTNLETCKLKSTKDKDVKKFDETVKDVSQKDFNKQFHTKELTYKSGSYLNGNNINEDNDIDNYVGNNTDNIIPKLKDVNTKMETKNKSLKKFKATVGKVLKQGLQIEIEGFDSTKLSKFKIVDDIKDIINKQSCKFKAAPAKVFICDVCAKSFTLPSQYRNHMDTHTDPVQCEHCPRMSRNKAAYKLHLKRHFGNKLVCEHCGRKFTVRKDLVVHLKSKHGYQKTDKCSFCDYLGSTAEAVTIHERTHTGVKPYVCEVCSAGFHRLSNLLQHKASHLTEKTVKCLQCPRLFKSRTLMLIHKDKHRPRAHRFRCRLCGAVYAKRWSCAQHARGKHAARDPRLHIERVRIADQPPAL